MGNDIIEKKPIKFIRRFLKPDLAIISLLILAGIITLALTKETFESGYDIFLVCIIIFLFGFAFFARVSSEYARERKTITKIENERDILRIELLDFDRPIKFSVELTNLEVTLSRSFTNGSSPLNIDFLIAENDVKKRLMRQHCNHAWKYYDVKEVFLTIKEMKNEKLSKKEKEIVDQGIGLNV